MLDTDAITFLFNLILLLQELPALRNTAL